MTDEPKPLEGTVEAPAPGLPRQRSRVPGHRLTKLDDVTDVKPEEEPVAMQRQTYVLYFFEMPDGTTGYDNILVNLPDIQHKRELEAVVGAIKAQREGVKDIQVINWKPLFI